MYAVQYSNVAIAITTLFIIIIFLAIGSDYAMFGRKLPNHSITWIQKAYDQVERKYELSDLSFPLDRAINKNIVLLVFRLLNLFFRVNTQIHLMINQIFEPSIEMKLCSKTSWCNAWQFLTCSDQFALNISIDLLIDLQVVASRNSSSQNSGHVPLVCSLLSRLNSSLALFLTCSLPFALNISIGNLSGLRTVVVALSIRPAD